MSQKTFSEIIIDERKFKLYWSSGKGIYYKETDSKGNESDLMKLNGKDEKEQIENFLDSNSDLSGNISAFGSEVSRLMADLENYKKQNKSIK